MKTPRLPFDEPARSTAEPELPDAADRAAAVDPRENVVLEASAGTGKTRTLVDRYVNLLIAGVDPANILAITFTRKAAAEMRERILDRLRELAGTGALQPARWRELRDRWSDVAIGTIDAFCLALLREFPLEADLDPGFEMADETETPRLVKEALDETLRACRRLASHNDTAALVVAELGEWRLREGLTTLLEQRLVAGPLLNRFVAGVPGDLTPALACTRAASRVADILSAVDGGLARFLADGPIRHPGYQLVAADLDWLATVPDVGTPEGIRRLRAALDSTQAYFFTRGGTPRKQWRYTQADASSAAALKGHRERARWIAERLEAPLLGFRRDLSALLAVGVHKMFAIAVDELGRTFEKHAVVDFTDATWRTLGLLDQMEEFSRSRFRLQARYRHLLVDEFQDTSRAHWALVWRLVEAWGEGAGAAEDGLAPSIFVVGDRKQSIYGFRDADVRVLLRAAKDIASLRQQPSVRRAIRTSFRAAPRLLAFTNDLFDAVAKDPDREDAFGYDAHDRFPVTLSPDAPSDEPVLGLAASTDERGAARAVAAEIERLLGGSTSVRDRDTGRPRPIEPGDIAILFRARDGHQDFAQALADRRIPNYVYKGLGFYEAPEVQDIGVLIRFLADPGSHARAAAFLRSRFIRLSDAALARLAPTVSRAFVGPDDPALVSALPEEDRQVLAVARPAVRAWLRMTDRLPPAELIDRILAESAYVVELAGPREHQARENLKKVRSLIRRVQNRGYATLARLATHLDRLAGGDESNAAIDAAGAVTLMTVHVAKGLEFPVVFLVNLSRGASGLPPPIRVGGDVDLEPLVSVGDFESAADDDAAARNVEESKRLLYVAVTRARDRLYLSTTLDPGSGRFAAGTGGLGSVLPSPIGALLEQAAGSNGGEVTWVGESAVHRFRVCPDPGPRAGVAAGQEEVPPPAPGDFAPVPPGSGLDVVPVTAAAHSEAPAVSSGSGGPASADARIVGRLVHRLFERAGPAGPGTDDRARLEREARTLVDPRDEASLADPAAAVGEAVSLFERMRRRPDVAALLAGGQLWHELPLVFESGGRLLRGTIDLLVDRPDGRLTVVEFKTGAPAPEHQTQLGLYVEAVLRLFPGRPTDGVLVYPDDLT